MRRNSLLPLVAALTLVGCNGWLTEAPEDFFTPGDFPAPESDLKIALAVIHDWYTGGSNQPYFNRGWPILTEVPSDQTITTQTSGSRYEQDSYTLGPSNEWLWRVWQQIYGAINQANVVIERIPRLTAVPQDVKDRYLGAFKFHRAFNHFNAVRVWGRVPLMMRPTSEFASATAITRAPIAEIYDSTAAFMNSFNAVDARKPVTFLTQVIAGTKTYAYHKADSTGFGDFQKRGPGFEQPMPYYGKFYDAGGPGAIALNNSRTDLNWPIYRYAEVELMYAEAENEAVGPDAFAYSAITDVRGRAKLPALTAGLSQDQFRDSVHQERSWELAFESKRVFDLKRWGEFYSKLKDDPVAKIGIKDFMVFMPIPQREIDLDPALGQNPGY